MRILSTLNRFVSNISAVLLGVMTIFVLLQVFFRYVLKSPISYSEELARFAMIWTVMFGATVAFRNKTHIVVDYFVEKLPKIVQHPIRVLQSILVLLFCLILVVKGYELSMQAINQLATASKIPIGYIILAFPISGAIIALYILEEFLKQLPIVKKRSKISANN